MDGNRSFNYKNGEGSNPVAPTELDRLVFLPAVNDVMFFAKMKDYYYPVEVDLPFNDYVESDTLNAGTSTKSTIIEALDEGMLPNDNLEVQKVKFLAQGQPFYVHYVGEKDTSNPHENIFATLLLSRTEFDAILSSIPNLQSTLHERLIQFSSYSDLKDDNFNTYTTANMEVVGLDINGAFTTYSSNLSLRILNNLQYNTFNSGTNIQLTERLTTPLTFIQLLDLVQKVEEFYSTSINNIILDDEPKKTVTRIRQSYYGWPGNIYQIGVLRKGLALGFNKGIPYSPYIEQNPYDNSNCSDLNIIPPTISYDILSDSCRNRQNYNLFHYQPSMDIIEERKELDQGTYTSLRYRQDVVVNNIQIDFGHTFLGLDSLLNPGNPAGKPGLPFRNTLDTEGFNIQHAIDFASYVGDLASVIGEAYLEVGGVSGNVLNSRLDHFFDERFDSTDHYGDVDIWGIKQAWDKLAQVQSGFKFSDVINFYYGPLTSNHDSSLPEHHSKRFTHFCRGNNFVDANNQWILPDPITGTNPDKVALNNRILNFAVFYYGPKQSKLNALILTSKLYFNRGTIDVSNWFNGFNPIHIDYVLEKFLSFVKAGYDNE